MRLVVVVSLALMLWGCVVVVVVAVGGYTIENLLEIQKYKEPIRPNNLFNFV